MTTKNPTPTEGRSNIMDELTGYVPSAEAVMRAESARRNSAEQYGGDATLLSMSAALSAAVPVEVARLLGEVRALVHLWWVEHGWQDVDDGPIHTLLVDLRAILDTVGVPAQVDEAATGGQS